MKLKLFICSEIIQNQAVMSESKTSSGVKIQEWLYDTLIHNSDLSKIEKFFYLKGLLEWPALTLVEAIHFHPDNYDLAYKTLLDRYTKPRIIACHYFNKIMDLLPLRSANFSNLRQLVDTLHVNVEALQSLNLDDLSGFL